MGEIKPVSINRLVHFVDANGVEKGAIVSKVHGTLTSIVDLHVFEPSRDDSELADVPPVTRAVKVPFDAGKKPWSWSWPERV